MIIPLHAANPSAMTGRGNWTYLLTGSAPALIDAGVGHDDHLDAIASALSDRLTTVIVTHAHSDHAAGVTALAARFPRARFFKWPWPDRDARYDVPWLAVADGDTIAAGDETLRVVHTPGHSPDHICLWHERSRTLFGGDLLVLGGTVVIPASAGGSLADYLQSLQRVASLAPARVLPSHGAEIDDPLALIRAYLDHRAERERQVLSAVAEGVRTVESIAERIYVGIPAALVRMAQETALAHLEKLRAEGRVRSHEGEWWIC